MNKSATGHAFDLSPVFSIDQFILVLFELLHYFHSPCEHSDRTEMYALGIDSIDFCRVDYKSGEEYQFL